jgi:hypothetical protein
VTPIRACAFKNCCACSLFTLRGALLVIAGAGIILTGHWATTDEMIADLIAGLLMLGFGVTILLMWSFQR